MGYPIRIQKPDLTYHVYSACVNRETYLSSKMAKDMFLDVIKMAQNKYDFKLHGFQIMEDHFHIIIMTTNEHDTVSCIMQYIKSVFARKLNRGTGRCGPLWNRRFHDTIIEKAQDATLYLIWLLWAIAYNPVRKGIQKKVCPLSKYSSIGFYLNETFSSLPEIIRPEAFNDLGSTFNERRDGFELCHQLFLSRLEGSGYSRFFPT